MDLVTPASKKTNKQKTHAFTTNNVKSAGITAAVAGVTFDTTIRKYQIPEILYA